MNDYIGGLLKKSTGNVALVLLVSILMCSPFLGNHNTSGEKEGEIVNAPLRMDFFGSLFLDGINLTQEAVVSAFQVAVD